MDKTIISPIEQMRGYDVVQFEHDVQTGLSWLVQDLCSGAVGLPVIGGLVATQSSPASLTFSLGAGRIYQLSANDATAVGSIAQDLTVQAQQGTNAGQNITLISPSAGQSQWNLVQGQFQQSDEVRSGDPNGGNVPFFNAANPTVPNIVSVNTVRRGKFILQVIQGASATTGSEVPPTPTSGWTPLYMVDLAGGQATILTSQILKCAPSAGVGVPANYPAAPFLRGLMASHHGGVPGQAPKILLGSEVTGVLPYGNMSPVRTLLSADLNLFVATTGNDNNNGTSPSTPFATIQAAVNAVMHNYDFNGFAPIINVANGTYTSGAKVSGSPLGIGGTRQLTIIGNSATPTACVINVTNDSCFLGFNGAFFAVTGFALSATGTAQSQGAGVLSFSSAISVVGGMSFGTCAFAHIYASGGVVSVSGAYNITANSPTHFGADASGFVNIISVTATIAGGLTFSAAFATSQRAGLIQIATSSFPGSTPTCTRFIVAQNGVISTNGGGVNIFPGTIAGVIASGGQYT